LQKKPSQPWTGRSAGSYGASDIQVIRTPNAAPPHLKQPQTPCPTSMHFPWFAHSQRAGEDTVLVSVSDNVNIAHLEARGIVHLTGRRAGRQGWRWAVLAGSSRRPKGTHARRRAGAARRAPVQMSAPTTRVLSPLLASPVTDARRLPQPSLPTTVIKAPAGRAGQEAWQQGTMQRQPQDKCRCES
jgi:hypothetical protein